MVGIIAVRNDNRIRPGHNLDRIKAEKSAEFLDIRLQFFQILYGRRTCGNLVRECYVRALRTQEHLASMHAGAGEIADDPLLRSMQIQHYDNAAGLIFAEETACSPADHHGRNFIFIRFHMNAGTVARIAFYIDPAAAHSV